MGGRIRRPRSQVGTKAPETGRARQRDTSYPEPLGGRDTNKHAGTAWMDARCVGLMRGTKYWYLGHDKGDLAEVPDGQCRFHCQLTPLRRQVAAVGDIALFDALCKTA